MSTLKLIPSEDAFKQHTALPATTLQVLYFHAPWATPCAQMSTVLTTLASTYPVTSPPSIVFLSIDAEELPDIAEEHEVSAVPFIVLQRDGKVLETISGGDAAKVREAVERHASADGTGKIGAQLPPAQTFTRPKEQPLPANATNGAQPPPVDYKTTTAPAKNLSAYAPGSSDPPTAPAFSSAETSSTTQAPVATAQEDLNTRLTQLVRAAPAMLFMKGTPSAPQCGFSRQLVSILRENNVRYGFFNTLADDEVRQGLKTFADWPTFPQLWLGGELVGGLDIVKDEVDRDPGFFGAYAVSKTGRNEGGPAGREEQAAPAA